MNPLLAAVKGTGKTVKDATTSTLQSAREAVISPSVAYSLGMGIGPWLRNMANASDKKDEKKDKKTDTNGLAKKEFAQLSTQFNTMVSLLRDIRSIGMTQLRADQQRLIDARRQEYFSKEAASENSGLLSGASITGTGKDGDGKSSLSILGEMMPTVLKMLAGGAVGAGIWNYIFDDKTRDKIKQSLFGEKGVWTTITDKYIEVLKSNPVETAIGTLIAARVTGALAALGFVGKFAYHGGRVIGSMSEKVGNVMQGPQQDKSNAARPGLQAAVEAAELSQLNRQVAPVQATTQSTAGMTAAEKLKHNRLLRAEIANNNAAAAAAKEAAEAAAATKASTGLLTKLGPIVGLTGKILSNGMIGLGAGVSAWSAKEDFEQGKTAAGTLNALSATLGVGALGSLFIPGAGPLVSGILATGSALTGMAGAAMSYFEKSKLPEQYHGTEGAQITATNVARNSNAQTNIPAEEVMSIIQSKFAGAGYGANQTWAALANAARESGFQTGAHNGAGEDSWGIFQMNRRGGLGVGYTPEQLSDPNFNTELLLANLKAAENRNDYFGDASRAFRDATTKEEAAEHLRRFLFGNGTAQQQLAGMARQNEINNKFEAGRYGRVPDFATHPTMASNGTGGGATAASPSVLNSTSITSSDARSGGILGEMTQLANDMTRLLAGGLMMASNDTNTTNNIANVSGGGTPAPRIDTSAIRDTVQHIAP